MTSAFAEARSELGGHVHRALVIRIAGVVAGVLGVVLLAALAFVVSRGTAEAFSLTAGSGPYNAGQKLLLNNEAVDVRFVSVSAGFNNEFGRAVPNPSDPNYTPSGSYFICKNIPVGYTVNAGSFFGSQELVFYLKTDESTPHTWYTGPGNRNSDGTAHARLTQLNSTTVRLEWEDLVNSVSDHDFNDCVVNIIITPLPTLTVIKQVMNDNGGTSAVGSFTIHVKSGGTNVSGSPQPGSGTGTTYTLNAGTYAVSEDAVSGYAATFSGDCDSSGNVTLALGQNKTCTITNNDIQPQLKVIKHVVNDNGGALTASAFTMTVTGSSPSPASFPGTESPGTTVALNASSYSVGETGPSGYASSLSAQCTGTITIGEVKTCTITNDDIGPTLTVNKVVVNDNGGTATVSSFTLKIDGNTVTSGVANAVTVGAHVVSEVAVSGYAATISGDCDGAGNVTLAIGDAKTCTITNNDIAPTLTVNKVVVNDNGGTAAVSSFTLKIDGNTVTSGVPNAVTVGAHVVSETAVAGYSGTITGDCDGAGNVTLAIGDAKTCTITNNDIGPTLTVNKVVVNDNGGTATVSSFTLKIDGNTVTSGVPNAVTLGAHVVSETSVAGYAGTITGDCDAGGNVALAIGQTKTCTITNDDIAPTLTVNKVVVNDNGGTATVSSFTLKIDGNTVTSGVPNAVTVGAHVVSETSVAGYAGTITGDCDAGGNVTLAIGQTKTCTITNDDIAPTLTVNKVVVNDNGGTATVSSFTLKIDGNTVTSGVANAVTVGAHVVSEVAVSGYAATISGDCDGAGNVTLAIGDAKTCTITNNDIAPTLTVNKVVVNDNGGTATVSSFTLKIDGNTVTSGVPNAVTVGGHVVSETAVAGYGGTISGDCDGAGNVTLAIGQTKTCTITNNDIAPTLTVNKVVVNDNGGTATVSSFTLKIDGNTVTSGVPNAVTVGGHVVSETAVAGYGGTISGDCDGAGNVTLAIGQTKTCTITNNDIQPQLTVIKHVINDNAGTSVASNFTLTVTGSSPSPASFPGAESPGTVVSLNAGSYSVGETGPSGYTLSASSDCAGMIAVGQTKTCTMTNDDNAPTSGTLTVIKQVTNNNGGAATPGSFTIHVKSGGVDVAGSPQPGSALGTAYTLGAGTYVVSEDANSGYTGTITGACTAGGSVTIAAGDAKTCTITNDDIQPQLTVIKHVINDNAGTSVASDFTLTVTGSSPSPASFPGAESPGTSVSLNAGAYSVGETGPSGYTQSLSSGCSGTIAVGQTKTCTMTNDDNGPVPSGTPVRMVKDTDGNTDESFEMANLFLCQGNSCIANGEGHLDVNEVVLNVGGDPDGVGAFEFQLKFDHKIFDILICEGSALLDPDGTCDDDQLPPAEHWLYSTGRIPGAAGVGGCAATIVTENDIRFGCVSKNPQNPVVITNGVQTDGIAAIIHVTPESDLVNRLTPGNNNGVIRTLLNENCELADIWGHPLSSSPPLDALGREILLQGVVTGGIVEDCADITITVRILEGDMNLDCKVDVLDDQAIASHYSAFFGALMYQPWYDLEPALKDFDVDIKDLQKVFGRNGSTCAAPIPLQDPLPSPQ